MEKKLDKIEGKIDKLIDQVNEVNVTLAKNTESLILHEKRTDLAEQRIAHIEDIILQKQVEYDSTLKELIKEISPIKSHVAAIGFTFKYIIPAFSAASALMWKLFSYLQNKQ